MIAARMARTERQVVERLRAAGALSPETVDTLGNWTSAQARRLSHLMRKRIVFQDRGGYYVDAQAWSRDRSRQRWLGSLLLLLIFVVIAVVALVRR